ncbi:hypothetical protein DAI22_07g073200 [Oryza sativa Japonica Group]|nr:hypothetical protein DAI22_07g073200 [Oryza sativa Japonica Group]
MAPKPVTVIDSGILLCTLANDNHELRRSSSNMPAPSPATILSRHQSSLRCCRKSTPATTPAGRGYASELLHHGLLLGRQRAVVRAGVREAPAAAAAAAAADGSPPTMPSMMGVHTEEIAS